jgi:hypothetical protein
MNAHHPAPTTDAAGKAGAVDNPRPLDSASVTKRLQQELMSLMCSGDSGVSAFPAGDSLFNWVGTLSVSLVPCGPILGPFFAPFTLSLSPWIWHEKRFRPPKQCMA